MAVLFQTQVARSKIFIEEAGHQFIMKRIIMKNEYFMIRTYTSMLLW